MYDLFLSGGGVAVGKTVVSKQGTSMATPVAAGHAALIRQYFRYRLLLPTRKLIAASTHHSRILCREGWYPTGVKTAANKMMPSASLIKVHAVSAGL